MKRVTAFVIAMMVFSAMARIAGAQPSEGPPQSSRAPRPAGPLMDELKRMSEDDVRALIETVRMVRLSQELGLNDEQTVLLVRQCNETKEETSKIQRERQEIAKELRELVTAGAPDSEIEKTLEHLIAKDKEAVMMRFDAFERAAAGLTPAQQAKLYVFMGDFEKRMRNLIEKAKAHFREQRSGEMREMMREGGPRRGGGYGGGYRRGEGYGGREGWRRAPEDQPAPAEEESPSPTSRAQE